MKRAILALFIIAVVGLCSVIVYFQINSQPVSTDTALRNFVINPGDGVNSISTRLQKDDLIRDKYLFLVLSHQLRQNNNLKPGLFKLSSSMSTSEIIQKIAAGGTQDYWLIIIEGQRDDEITPKFDEKNEGYLFPDSYLIPNDYTPDNILTVINKNFVAKFAQAKATATNTQLTDAQIVILASLLEREARTLASKQQIAGILMNRLNINMALQIDASVQYARDTRLQPKVYWTPATKADLAIVSPYNTYLNPGLPPGPICNPGYDSLYAAFHPTDSNYMYYISDNNGVMHYAKTLPEHNANVAKYLK